MKLKCNQACDDTTYEPTIAQRYPLEHLLVQALAAGMCLEIGASQANNLVVVTFKEGLRKAGVRAFAVSELVRLYGTYPQLAESVFSALDEERGRNWFRTRNRICKIRWSRSFNSLSLPAYSAAKLILSYALSAHGVVQIAKHDKDRTSLIYFQFAYFVSDLNRGWRETMVLPSAKLVDYLSRNSAARSDAQ